jgi:hypothetical protein
MIDLILQLPPTPTPIPPMVDAPLELPESLFWDSAPDVVGVWNNANQSGLFTLVQFLAVAILVILFLGLLYRVIRQVTR